MTDELEDISPEGAEPDADGEGDGESELLEVVDVGNDQTTEARSEQVSVPDRLPLLPIRNAVAFPGTVMPLEISREKSRRVLDLALNQSRMIGMKSISS